MSIAVRLKIYKLGKYRKGECWIGKCKGGKAERNSNQLETQMTKFSTTLFWLTTDTGAVLVKCAAFGFYTWQLLPFRWPRSSKDLFQAISKEWSFLPKFPFTLNPHMSVQFFYTVLPLFYPGTVGALLLRIEVPGMATSTNVHHSKTNNTNLDVIKLCKKKHMYNNAII